jgi:hypothetical protein
MRLTTNFSKIPIHSAVLKLLHAASQTGEGINPLYATLSCERANKFTSLLYNTNSEGYFPAIKYVLLV